jgi:hypothetical protein
MFKRERVALVTNTQRQVRLKSGLGNNWIRKKYKSVRESGREDEIELESQAVVEGGEVSIL